MAKTRQQKKESMRIRVFDGTRNPISNFPVMYRISNGEHEQLLQKEIRAPELSVRV